VQGRHQSASQWVIGFGIDRFVDVGLEESDADEEVRVLEMVLLRVVARIDLDLDDRRRIEGLSELLLSLLSDERLFGLLADNQRTDARVKNGNWIDRSGRV
jgi:hypothetical protein